MFPLSSIDVCIAVEKTQYRENEIHQKATEQ